MKKNTDKQVAARRKENLAQKLKEQDLRIEEGLRQLNSLIDQGLIQKPSYRLSLNGWAPQNIDTRR